MTVLFEGLTHTCDWQIHVMTVDPVEYPEPDFLDIFSGTNGERKAVAQDDFLVCKTGMGYGRVPLLVTLHDADPGPGGSDDMCEVPTWTVTGTRIQLTDTNGSDGGEFTLTAGVYAGRYHCAGWDAGFEQDTTAEAPAPDSYRLDLWRVGDLEEPDD